MHPTKVLSGCFLVLALSALPAAASAQLCNDDDNDSDGCSCLGGDCDDSDPTVRGSACTGGARPELCDSKDNDCNAGTADGSAEGWYQDACDGTDDDLCTEGSYQCSGGNQVCNDPNDVDLDLCNTVDDDCDPSTANGADESWLNQACDGTDLDLCNEGIWSCTSNTKTCSDPNDADPDLCNAANEDCDPSTPNGAAEPWYGDPCDGADLDLCDEGTSACADRGGGDWGEVCSDVSATNPELCDATDNDCDGSNNEDWPTLGQSCDGGDADLCANGTVTCLGNGSGTQCTESVHVVDLCNNNTNDDCDATTADGSGESWYNDPCDGTDADACTEGTDTCTGGVRTCTDANDADPDVCNGLDDDCRPATADGSTEAWFGQACDGADTDQCLEGTAICANLGAGVWGQGCSDVSGNTIERCDGIDNDCDGSNNEDWPTLGQACDGGDADQCVNGTVTCLGNGSGTQCSESIHVIDACNNNTNDDCNAATPDGSGETWYGDPCDGSDADLCAEGTYSCTGGGQQCSDPNDVDVEVCDATDNDCDGTNNEGFDGDGDGVGRCDVAAGDGCTTFLGPTGCDCDDADHENFPGNTEVCDGQDNDCDGLIDETFDVDGDGFLSCTGCTVVPCDCDDDNIAIFPGAPEICNCTDEDCDGAAWNGFADADGDLVPACASTECDDADAQEHGAFCGRVAVPEACDTRNNDCDGQTDEGLSRACYSGPSGTNGVGLCHGGTQSCAAVNTNPADPANWGACSGEVTPANPPLDPEVTCDNQDEDCDGTADDGLRVDADGDGVRACGSCGAPAAPACDCNDGDAAVKPGAVELCDAVDQNCDGSATAGVPSRLCFEGANVTATTYTGDCPGHAVSCQPRGACHVGSQSCQAGGVWSACGGALVLPTNDPAASEALCDNRDSDCDGAVDDGAFDGDGDGTRSCALCAFLNAMSCDCDDSRVDVKPGGTEVCDGADNDCSGTADDDGQGGVLRLECYSGQPPETLGVGLCIGGYNLCAGAAGYSSACSGEVTPAADDPCDGHDNDCDGTRDEGFDQDADGVTTCAGDCNDTDPDMYVGNLEICDGKDNDCDGDVDGVLTACYTGHASTRGVGLCAPGQSQCSGGVPVGDCVGQVLPTTDACDDVDNDCDGDTDEDFDADHDGYRDCAACSFLAADACDCQDGDPHNNPGSVEFCDCQDNDCDDVVDEDGACEGGACHDLDQDGFRNCDGDCNDRDSRVGPGFAEIWSNGVDDDCDGAVDEDVDEDRDGATIGQGDCDDRFAEIRPGHTEVCDGFDNNCDGVVDEGFDDDGDHATTCAGDCDDTDSLRSPLRREVCGDGIDNDCDGIVDPDTDIDGDGVTTCQGDCNDHNAAVHGAAGSVAAATEVCDGQDNDCNGPADEGFNQDGDRWVSCLGDCDDGNADVNPDRLELAGNGVDDDCDGAVDEGELDQDGDGFSPNCGDCDDADLAIHPHADEACDRIDNNCDGYVDARLGAFDLCATCFDADADGLTNCDGDCDDSEPSVYPGAPEICDLLDNDCDHSVDLDPLGFSVCTAGEDGGVEDGGGEDALVVGVDAGGVVVVDAGADAGPADAQGVLRLGCGCGALQAGSSRAVALLLMAGVLLTAWLRRRGGRRRWAVLIGAGLLLAAIAAGCDSRLVVPGVVEPRDGGDGATEAGAGDAAVGLDAEEGWDQGARDRAVGDLATTACPVNSVIAQTEAVVPGTELRFAVPPATSRIPLEGVEAFALDDLADDVLGFVLRQPLPAGLDPADEHAASAFALDEVQVLDQLPTSPPVAARIEAHRRVLRDLFGRVGVSSVQNLTFPTPVSTSYVRRATLAALAHLLPGTILGLPAALPTAPVATEHVVQVLFLFAPESVMVVLATTPAASYPDNRILMGDLSNATHVGMSGYTLRKDCEVKTLPELRSDFLWVIDNSASMQEEQQALSAAAGSFYGALVQSGLDFRLGVVTTDGEVLQGGGFTTDLATFENNVRVGINGNGRELGLEYGLRAIETARASSDPVRQLRSDAALVVIFVSDEDSINLRSVDAYAEAYRAAGAQVSAIVGPRPWGCQRVGLGVARPGHAYIEVAEATGGASGSICNPNLVETITAILIGAAGAASRSSLQRQPVSNSLAVQVQRAGVFEPSARSRQVGFDYEPGANSILFFGDLLTLPPAGSLFEVAYQYFAYIEG